MAIYLAKLTMLYGSWDRRRRHQSAPHCESSALRFLGVKSASELAQVMVRCWISPKTWRQSERWRPMGIQKGSYAFACAPDSTGGEGQMMMRLRAIVDQNDLGQEHNTSPAPKEILKAKTS